MPSYTTYLQVKILENATVIRLSKHKFEWETLLIVFQQHQFTIHEGEVFYTHSCKRKSTPDNFVSSNVAIAKFLPSFCRRIQLWGFKSIIWIISTDFRISYAVMQILQPKVYLFIQPMFERFCFFQLSKLVRSPWVCESPQPRRRASFNQRKGKSYYWIPLCRCRRRRRKVLLHGLLGPCLQ